MSTELHAGPIAQTILVLRVLLPGSGSRTCSSLIPTWKFCPAAVMATRGENGTHLRVMLSNAGAYRRRARGRQRSGTQLQLVELLRHGAQAVPGAEAHGREGRHAVRRVQLGVFSPAPQRQAGASAVAHRARSALDQ